MNRLWVRLSLAFGAVVLVGVATLILISTLIVSANLRQRFIGNELRVPGGLVDELTGYYQTHGSWDGVGPLMAGAGATLPNSPRDRLILSLADADGQIVYHRRGERIGQFLSHAERLEALPIQITGEATNKLATVGYLRVEFVSGNIRRPPGPPGPRKRSVRWILIRR